MHVTRQSSGQSLLEAIVAIGVILTTVISSSTLIISSITAGRVSQNRVEAANFAREGVEIVRALRDSNWLKFEQNERVGGVIPSWDTGLGAGTYIACFGINNLNCPGPSPSGWNLKPCFPAGVCTGQDTIYRFDNGVGVYYTQSLTPCSSCIATKYRRTVTLSAGTDTVSPLLPYVLVVSTVRWDDRTGSKTLTAQARLYDWK